MDYDALLNEQVNAPAQKASPPSAVSYDDLLSQVANSKQDKPAEPAPGWSGFIKGFADRWELGSGGLAKGAIGWQLAGSALDMERAQKSLETKSLIRAQMDTEDYRNTHDYWDLAGIKVGASDVMGGWLVEQLPQLGMTGLGAVGGMAFAASLGTPIGWGALAGGALFGGAIMGGNMVYDLMERGVDRETAIKGGLVSGAAGAALEMIGLHGEGKVAAGAIEAAVKSPEFKQTIARVVGEMAKGLGTEVATEDLQSISDSTVKWLATKNTQKPFTLKEAQQDLIASTIQTIPVAAGISGGAGIVGAGIGQVSKRVHAQLLAVTLSPQQPAATLQGAVTLSPQELEANRARAKRKSRKFLDVGQNQALPVADALRELEDAQRAYDSVPNVAKDAKVLAKLDLDLAEQTLKESRLQARIDAIENALTDPDLAQSIEVRKQELTERLDAIDEAISKLAATGANPRALDGLVQRRADMVTELAELANFSSMSEDQMRAKLQEMKGAVSGAHDKVKSSMARAALNRRIAKQESKLNALKAEQQSGIDPLMLNAPGETRLERAIRETDEKLALEKFTLELLDEGLLDAEEVDRLAAKTPRSPIGKLNGLLKLVERKIDAAAKLGQRSQRTASRAIRQIIDRVILASRLPQADKDALRLKLNGAATVDELTKIYPGIQGRIQEVFEKRRKKALLADLDNIVGSIKAKKRERSKFPGVEELLLAIAALVKNRGEADNVRQTLANHVANNQPLNFQQQALQTAVDLWFPGDGDVNAMTSDQIEELINAVSDLKTRGRTAKLNAVLEARAKSEDAIATVKDALLVDAKTGKRKSPFETKAGAHKYWSSAIVAPWRSWEGIMQLITKNGTLSALTDVFDLKKANHDYWEHYDKWTQKLSARVYAVVNSADYARRRIEWEGQSDPVMFAGFDDQGNVVDRQLVSVNGDLLVMDPADVPKRASNPTVWELIQVRNHLLDEDPDAVSRMSKGNGFTYKGEVPAGQSTLEAVESALNDVTPDALKVADAFRAHWQEFGSSAVDDASVRRFGRHVELNATYGGPLLSDPTQRYGEMFRRMSTRPASLLERTGGSRAVKIRSALDNVSDAIHQYSREAAYYDFEMTARAVFADSEIRKIIERTSGKNTVKLIDKYIEDLINGHFRAYSAASDVFGLVRRQAFTRYLGLKPTQYIKQLTSFVYAFQTGVSVPEVFEAYATFLSDPKHWIEKMNASPVLKARGLQMDPDYKGGGIPIHLWRTLLETNMTGAKKAQKLMDLAENVSLKSLAKGDIHGVYLAAFPAYLKALKATGSEEKAQLAFERAFETTQSSGALEELPALFRGSHYERMGTIFTQQPTRQAEMIHVAWEKYLNTGKREDFAHLTAVAATSWMGALLYNLVGTMLVYPFLAEDDREKKLATAVATSVLGPYAGVAYLGTVLTPLFLAAVASATDTTLNIHEPGFLLTDTLGSFVQIWLKTVRLIANGEMDGAEFWKLVYRGYKLFGAAPEPLDIAIKGGK